MSGREKALSENRKDESQQHQVVTVTIEGSIDRMVAENVAEIVASQEGGLVAVSATQCARAHGMVFTPQDFELARTLAAIISALVALSTVYKQVRDQSGWDSERLLKCVRDKMLGLGSVTYCIESVERFDDLVKGKPGPCIVVVVDSSTGVRYRIYLFRKGNGYTMRLG